jgi:hypothetical protein
MSTFVAEFSVGPDCTTDRRLFTVVGAGGVTDAVRTAAQLVANQVPGGTIINICLNDGHDIGPHSRIEEFDFKVSQVDKGHEPGCVCTTYVTHSDDAPFCPRCDMPLSL